mmetsp:Transcript_10498/g.11984  ORF Transcript_10498/g.11984 Transcript_10498/m.11984 type:complete len:401 (+) Transcript_10498:238-1440(+)
MFENSVDLRSTKSGLLTAEQALAINSDIGTLTRFLNGIPKAELHIHIEGTFEPGLMLSIAKRNGLDLEGYEGDNDESWCKAEKEKRRFNNLQEFLDLYYAGCDVLKSEDDFFELAMGYFRNASSCNVRYAEISFDPQTHTKERNQLDISVVINGLSRACEAARELLPPVEAKLIMCFLRHRHTGCAWATPPAEGNEALKVMEEVIEKGLVSSLIAVGLDSSEQDNPPELFKDAYDKARENGLHCVGHAGEEGPAEYITKALDVLKVERIDHGVRCLEDKRIVDRLAQQQIPLTVCPCSNHRLKVADRFFSGENPVRQLLNHGLKVTLNSDDPAYFFGHRDKFGEIHGGYINSNYLVTAKECALTADEIVVLALNSFESCFSDSVSIYKEEVTEYCENFKP